MEKTVNAKIDVKELKETMGVDDYPTWKQIPIVYAMVGWIFTLGGGAFLSFGLLALMSGGYFYGFTPVSITGYAILAILVGAIFTGLSHIYD